MSASSHTRQLLGSLLAALVIVAVTIAVVTASLGPNAEEDHGGHGRGGGHGRAER